MGDHEAARELDADTLRRRRRVLGKGHPDTRRSAENLARDRRALRETGWRGWRAGLRRRPRRERCREDDAATPTASTTVV